MRIRPIRNEKDHRWALKQIEALWDSGPGTRRADELDILSTLVAAYEAKNHNILPPNPVAAVKFRMEQLGLSHSDVAPLFGGRNRVSEILRGRRRLTIKIVGALHRKLGIPAESLIA